MNAVYGKLAAIQAELKAPKNQYNSFGKYNYRSCEDILEAVKPLAKAQGCAVLISDEAVAIDGWHYVKATAQLGDIELEGVVQAVAFAREPESKKGMDTSQITGTASSYARKYALSGLFALDDTKDADGQDNRNTAQENRNSAQEKSAADTQKYCCADCGRPFVDVTDVTGAVWSPKRQYEAAVKVSVDGKARCKECRGKQGNNNGWN